MNRYEQVQQHLAATPRTWLVSGVAGFIGSNLLEALLKLGQSVIGLDSFATGYRRNLNEVQTLVTPEQWARFRFVEGDIRDLDACHRACAGAEFVLHQAALGSVPRSLADPVTTSAANVTGFLSILVAARNAGVQRFVYAASSSTYGDHPGLPKVEDTIGRPLNPYAVTKYVNKLYTNVFVFCYAIEAIGLRYFNVFGPWQDPEGAYAAVIPRWIVSLIRGEDVFINGDGETSRDFCYVANVLQANLISAVASGSDVINQVYNIAAGDRTCLNTLHITIRDLLKVRGGLTAAKRPIHLKFRERDVRHSLADISKPENSSGTSQRNVWLTDSSWQCHGMSSRDNTVPRFRQSSEVNVNCGAEINARSNHIGPLREQVSHGS